MLALDRALWPIDRCGRERVADIFKANPARRQCAGVDLDARGIRLLTEDADLADPRLGRQRSAITVLAYSSTT